MAKISKHGGPSDKLAITPPTEDDQARGGDTIDHTAPGGEQPSAGSSSKASSPKPERSDGDNSGNAQSLAPTTENPSDKAQTGSGSARTTGGTRTSRSS